MIEYEITMMHFNIFGLLSLAISSAFVSRPLSKGGFEVGFVMRSPALLLFQHLYKQSCLREGVS